MSSARNVYGWLVAVFAGVLLVTALLFALGRGGAEPLTAGAPHQQPDGERAAGPPAATAPSSAPATVASGETAAATDAASAPGGAPAPAAAGPPTSSAVAGGAAPAAAAAAGVTDPHAGHPHHYPADHPVTAATTPTASAAAGRAEAAAPEDVAATADFAFAGDRAETERFLAFERAIQLTPEQEAIRVAALEALPAPCCKEFSAATCCCPCNMARSTWGLAKHLIVHQGAGVERVRAAAAAWHLAINPSGFSGDVCATGGCGRPFAHNGCGGMGELVFPPADARR